MHYDYLIVGAGLYGATFAREAIRAGKKVLIIDRRQHVAGSAYTEKVEDIQVHKYGPHIFHTNNAEVWRYVRQFAVFNNYINKPLANYHGAIYPLPFNMDTFNRLWGLQTPEEAKDRIDGQRKELSGEPRNLEEQAVSLVGREIYEILVKGYTEKQWGRSCKELPASIIRRLPVRFAYDNNYYDALYQGIPVGGYTQMVEHMLKGVEVRLGVDYLDDKEYWDAQADRIVYTGPIDAYFAYSLGTLEYRSVRFETEIYDMADFQGNAVVNYTAPETPWTRIVEHKWFEFGVDKNGSVIPKTVISREYSYEWKPGEEPYYPINDEKNTKLYQEYRQMADAETNVIFGGRLADYRYYDMDQVIACALKKTKEVLK